MADNTKIEWADATVNAINGCSVISPGCTHCYAMKLAGTRMRNHPTRARLTIQTKAGPVWNGVVRLHEPALLQPLAWKRPRRIFWNAHGDTFHENVPYEWIDQVFAVCALTPQHTHMILTKRSARMRQYFEILRERGGTCDSMSIVWDVAMDIATEHGMLDRYQPTIRVLPNVWLGVSVEDQRRADERIPDLLATPAAVRFISAEPLLGPVDIDCPDVDWSRHPAGNGIVGDRLKIDWVIAGGESGPGARPMHPDWARALRDQCADAGIPFHFKQWGAWATVFDRDRDDPDWRNCGRWEREYPKGRWHNLAGGTGFHGDRVLYVAPMGKKAAGRLLDGVEHNGMPRARHG